ncbi:MAG: hypothetical protein HC822_09885 [Oscillochloris sp.]|nr:hypothetical protein [Oscillochloris sp.]
MTNLIAQQAGLATATDLSSEAGLFDRVRRSVWLTPVVLTVLALIHGLIYVFLVPPWEHYDEPGHFHYAADFAFGEGFRPGSNSVMMNREIADSMARNGFADGTFFPDLTTQETADIAISQRVHPPLYYMVAGAVIAPVRYLPIETQLYIARSLSVALYILTILAAWRITVIVVPDEPLIQFGLPLLLLFHAAFTDLMSAVNNDVLVNMAATVAILGSVLLVREGPRPLGFALAGLGLLVAIGAKRSGLLVSVPVLLGVLFAIRRAPFRRRMIIALIIALPILIGMIGFRFPTSAESGSGLLLLPRDWLLALDESYLRLHLIDWLHSVVNPRSFENYPQLVFVGFTSFWARLGWGQISLGPLVDGVFTGLVLCSLLGLLISVWQLWPELTLWQRRCLWIFAATAAVAFLSMFGRLHPLALPDQRPYIPRGRYIFWAMTPLLWLFLLGLMRLLPASWRRWGLGFLLGALLLLDIFVIAVVLPAAYFD